MSKALISFLGTNDYLECRYRLDGSKSDYPVKYIQEDMALRFCKEWTAHDEIRIFTTRKAKKINWRNNGHVDHKSKKTLPNRGLEERLQKIDSKATIRQMEIAEGNTESEIWEIFEAVYNSLRENEEILFDITHGFRSIPMLFMSLMGYARLLKNISVDGIYYGAFEVLGNFQAVKAMDMEKRIAPVFDLTSFAHILEWTEATQSFVKNGSAREFARLASTRIGPMLKESKGKDQTAKKIALIMKGIERISKNILMNRGTEIVNYDYELLKQNIQDLNTEDVTIKPLVPLIGKAEKKIEKFMKEDVLNGFHAVEWAMDHDLYPQAITMLQESMVTLILSDEGLDWGKQSNRIAVSSAIKLFSMKDKKFNTAADLDQSLANRLLSNGRVEQFYHVFEGLRGIRNDVSHCGFITDEDNHSRSAESIREKFMNIYHDVKQIFLVISN